MDLLNAFVISAKGRGLSETTVELYSTVVQQMTEVVGSLPPSLEDIERYISEQMKVNSPTTVNTKLQVVKSFCGWAKRAGITECADPADLPTVIHGSPKPKIVPSSEEIAILESHLRPKHKASLRLMSDAGLRVGEVVGLHPHNVHIESRVIMVKGKGKKERVAPITTDELIDAIEPFVKENNEWLIPGRGGQQMTVGAIQKAITRACTRAGIRHLTPHSFRHAFAARAVETGVHTKAVQEALGHSSLSTTEVYLSSLERPSRIANAFRSFHRDEKGG